MGNKEGEQEMIAFDFEYYKPNSITETVEKFNALHAQGKKAFIFSGGTEFITFSRVNKINADAVIDIKGIPECNVLEIQDDQLIIGTAVSLNKITASNLFPLLGQTVKKIADHTSRNKITIGGNMNSQLIYRESVLPLLLADAKVKIARTTGEEIVPLDDIFNTKQAQVDFLVQIIIDTSYLELPSISLKRTKFSKIGYPVVSLAALIKDHKIRVALSGVCDLPFRSAKIENILNDTSFKIEERIEQVLAHLPSPIVDDIHGSVAYREFVLTNTLFDMMKGLKIVK